MSPNAALSVLLCLAVTAANAIVCPDLECAGEFVIVSYMPVTDTGFSVVKGKLAVYPSSLITGFAPNAITGAAQLGTAVAAQAQIAQTSAYNYCKNISSAQDLTGTDLAGQTLTPGVYKFTSTAAISAGGILTFKGAGCYIFQVGSTITTGAGSQMVVEDGAKPGCIFWQVGSSATLGATSTFLGNILAYASVTFGSTVTYKGAVYAQTGGVTLINDTITHERCNLS
jgi:hypothetical protein